MSQGEMKRVAKAGEPPVVIPVIVVAVDVHVPLVIPPVERGEPCIIHHLFQLPQNTLRVGIYSIFKIPKCLIPSIFIFCLS